MLKVVLFFCKFLLMFSLALLIFKKVQKEVVFARLKLKDIHLLVFGHFLKQQNFFAHLLDDGSFQLNWLLAPSWFFQVILNGGLRINVWLSREFGFAQVQRFWKVGALFWFFSVEDRHQKVGTTSKWEGRYLIGQIFNDFLSEIQHLTESWPCLLSRWGLLF